MNHQSRHIVSSPMIGGTFLLSLYTLLKDIVVYS